MREKGRAKENRRFPGRVPVILLICVALISSMPGVATAGACPKGGNHEFKVKLVRQATNSNDGLRTYTCIKCKYSYDEVIKNFGHHWSKWTVVTKPTCDTTGVKKRKCTGCGQSEKRMMDSPGHDWGPWEKEGEKEVRVCQRDSSHIEERNAPGVDEQTTVVEEVAHNETSNTVKDKNADSTVDTEVYEEGDKDSSWTTANTVVAAGGGLILMGLGFLLFTTCISPWLWILAKRRRKRDEMRRRMYS